MLTIARWKDLLLPLGIISSVLVILVPLPTWLLDLLLVGNITVAVIVLLTTIYVKTPLEFSVFPSLLLAATLGRLVLNVATTRAILSKASGGGVIDTFGGFVAGQQLVIGIIIFAIIIVIQFVVITKGATRIAEVAARFALDGMPGRQMAIDADLNAGIIDDQEAQRRRQEITRQADFYGAMDGASKFVRGDAIAGVIITIVNIAGGLYLGVFQHGLALPQAAETFTRLTIGDGLASQVPALLVSLAAGLLVTRSTEHIDLPDTFLRQVFARPQALLVAAGFLGILIFTKMPTFPLLTLGAGCCGLAFVLNRQNQERAEQAAQTAAASKRPAPKDDRIEDFLAVDPMEMEIGLGLIRLADPKRGGDLLSKVTRVRQAIAREIGIILPKVRIRDNMRLGELAYRIKISNNLIAEGIIHPDKILALDPGTTSGKVDGELTSHPALAFPGVWIEPGAVTSAERMGYRPVTPTTVLSQHLQDVARRHADELLSRDATKSLIDSLRDTSPTVIDELIPGQMSLGEVQKVLQLLLQEQVPIRQLGVILEAMGDGASRTKDPVFLAEFVRQRLARTICSQYRDAANQLHVVTLDPALEDRLLVAAEHQTDQPSVDLTPEATNAVLHELEDELDKLSGTGKPRVVLVSPEIRIGFKRLTAARFPNLVVLSYYEVTSDTQIESVGMIQDVSFAEV